MNTESEAAIHAPGTLRDGLLLPATAVALTLPEPEGGLNAAVTSARAAIAKRGGTRIVTLAADLPQVTPADVEALCILPAGVIGIAPDRYGTGTNALSLPLPQAKGFTFCFGPDTSVA